MVVLGELGTGWLAHMPLSVLAVAALRFAQEDFAADEAGRANEENCRHQERK